MHWFSMHSAPSFHAFMFWSTGMRLAVMSVQDKLICVRLVMPRCMFSMQLFLSEIVKFRSSSVFNTRATCLLHLAQAQNVHTTVE